MGDDEVQIDKRMYERYKISCSGVLTQSGEDLKIELLNVSEQGIGLRTANDIEEGDQVTVKIEYKDMKTPLIVTGEVMWVNEYEDYFESGLKVDFTAWPKMTSFINQLSG